MFLVKINKLRESPLNINKTIALMSNTSILLKCILGKAYRKSNKKNINFATYFYNLLINNVTNTKLFINSYINNILTSFQLKKKYNKIYLYLLKINFLKSNIMVSLTNTKGNILLKNSSGMMGFKSRYKTKSVAFNTVLKKLKFKIRNLREFKFSVHILGVKKKKPLIAKLKNFITIKSIKNFNLIPFNGCREKKRKRKKRKRNLQIV
jgi:ribosomal protein S11